jgi:four helix bundle protein
VVGAVFSLLRTPAPPKPDVKSQAIQRAFHPAAALAQHVRVNHRRGPSQSDYARFVEIATGSVFEVASQATIGRNQGFLDQVGYDELYRAAEKQSRMLSGLKNSLVAG